jgi:hypothetical protein
MTARARRLLVVEMPGVQEHRSCRRVSQLPDLTPIDFALLPRVMPAADFGANHRRPSPRPPAGGCAVRRRIPEPLHCSRIGKIYHHAELA